MRALALLPILLSTAALAAEPAPDEAEHVWGATNVNAALGDGHLSVGVAATGEVTVMRFPGPTGADQVRYQTRVMRDRTQTARQLPHFGASADQGVFAGIHLGSATLWLHEANWSRTQEWQDLGSPVLVTRYRLNGGSLEVTQKDFVVWQQNVMVRQLRISGVTGHGSLVAYAAFAPCTGRSTGAPLDDYLYDAPSLDGPTDYALFYSPRDDGFIAFRPNPAAAVASRQAVQDAVFRGRATTQNAAEEVSLLDRHFGPGVYVAWGADVSSTTRSAANLPIPGLPAVGAPPAFDDAADGALSNQLAAAAPAAGALSFDFDATPDVSPTLTLFYAFGATAVEAQGGLAEARRRGYDGLEADTLAGWAALMQTVTWPNVDDTRVQAVARRAVMTMVGASDAASGALVSSISTQPPWAEDQPNDSAFISYALRRAGLLDFGLAHATFLARSQQQAEAPGRPPGSFASALYADGRAASVTGFAFDSTARALTSLTDQAKFLESAGRTADADKYRNAVYPAVKRSADLLASCKDPSGLPCPALQSDSDSPVQSLRATTAAIVALRGAAAFAAAVKATGDAQAWTARAEELQRAAAATFVDGALNLTGERGPRAFSLWTESVVAKGSDTFTRELDAQISELQARVGTVTPGSAGDALPLAALTAVLQGDAARLDRLGPLVDRFVRELPTGTGEYGEGFVATSFDGGRTAQVEQRSGVPHATVAALAYVTALNYYGERKPGLGPAPLECGCGSSGGAALAGLAMLGVVLLRRRS